MVMSPKPELSVLLFVADYKWVACGVAKKPLSSLFLGIVVLSRLDLNKAIAPYLVECGVICKPDPLGGSGSWTFEGKIAILGYNP
jgi:hypothetical protein